MENPPVGSFGASTAVEKSFSPQITIKWGNRFIKIYQKFN
jgi:hypothetical protein